MQPISRFKADARRNWSTYAPTEMVTASVAPKLIQFAEVCPGMDVLDVGCGTGVAALTAARMGANVTGVDLTPSLLERAKENAHLMGQSVDWVEGDVEALPLKNSQFDIVVSQFGHMFAPRPLVAIDEMLRVLKPGGTIAFSTWPPESVVGRVLALLARWDPESPDVPSPCEWGTPSVVRERLSSRVEDTLFVRDIMQFQIMSPQHYRMFMENAGVAARLAQTLKEHDPVGYEAFGQQMEKLVAPYFHYNVLPQDYLLSRAVKSADRTPPP